MTARSTAPSPAEKPAPANRWPRFPKTLALRGAAFAIAAIPLVLLVIASQLEPDSRGLGTHQQLGFPPCSMRLMFGIRCPGCGMTTSWAHFVRGELGASANANPAGMLLAVFSLGVAALALRVAFTAKLPGRRTQTVVTILAVAILLTALVHWGFAL